MAVFARKASGLAKQASLFDAFALGFMNGGIGGGLWTMHSWGLYTFPGGNMVLASIVTMILTVCGVSLAWGILGGSMPRSGGDYVYNSRIVHPALGTATSWVEGVFTQLAWMWLLAPLIASPGVSILAGALGVPYESVAFFDEPAGIFLVATIAMIIGFLVMLAGLKSYLWAQKICFVVGMAGVVIGLLLITFTPAQTFITRWDAVATEYGSASYEGMITSAGEGFAPSTWNWTSTLGLVPSVTWSVSYGFYIGYIGGEIKRPERNILMAQLLSALVPSIVCAWAGYVFQNNLGYEFMGAVAYADNEAPAWYAMPFPANWANFAAILTNNPILQFLIGAQFMLFNWLYLPISFIVFTRVLFAQALDQIGPRWFLDLNPRFGAPIKLYTLFFILSEAFIAIYSFVYGEWLGGISIEVLDAMAVWGIIGIVCMLFPFVKKTKHIWDASPHRWTSVAVLAGVVSLILSGVMVWAFYTSPNLGFSFEWSVVFIAVAIVAILWYFGWRLKRAKEGIDVTLAFKELPPE